jgi:hypothetical protein
MGGTNTEEQAISHSQYLDLVYSQYDMLYDLTPHAPRVRKIGPRSNKIKQMQKQNTKDTQYNRDTDLRGSPSVGYVHQRNCQVLPLLLSNK